MKKWKTNCNKIRITSTGDIFINIYLGINDSKTVYCGSVGEKFAKLLHDTINEAFYK